MINRKDLCIRDPFVFAENDLYYLLGTTGSDPWQKGSDLTLYFSKDLENFQEVCTLVTDGCLDSYTNIWAPEVHKYCGKYYLIVSAFRKDLGRGSLIFVSDRLDENFKMLTGEYITPCGWGCLDATLFVYEKKPYLCFSNEWTTTITNDGDGSLFIVPLKDDLTEKVGKPKKIVSGKSSEFAIEIGDEKKRGYVAEGPYLYEEDGKIVLLWSTIGTDGYMVIQSVSKTGAMGDYEFERVLFREDGGHCMCFEKTDGTKWIAFHQPNITPNERMNLRRIKNQDRY
ncbi:MAG: family 43 glycosylhydrolase [Clostridia bacterium]|nr:family 43 glycosylhydrolase [Clostridia bacterium]